MKFVHVSDLHLGYQQFGLEQRFDDFSCAFERIVDRTIELSADALVIAGDLFNKRDLNARTLLVAMDTLDRLRAEGIPVVAVEGNHDKAFRSDGLSWMEFLNRRGRLILLRPEFEDGVLQMPEWDDEGRTGARVVIDGIEFCGLGYLGALASRTLTQVPEALPQGVAPRVLMLHAGVGGEGPDIGRVRLDAVEPLREHFAYVALGHVHHRYERDGWIFNPGAPENWDLGEAGQEKGLYVVDLDPTGGPPSVAHEPSRPRPAVVAKIDLTGTEHPGQARERVLAQTDGLVPGRDALLRLVLAGEAPYASADIDTAGICAALQGRDGWLFIESDAHVNEPAWQQASGLLASPREEIERAVLSQLVSASERLSPLGDRAVEALLEIKELVRTGADADALADLALACADAVPLETEPGDSADSVDGAAGEEAHDADR